MISLSYGIAALPKVVDNLLNAKDKSRTECMKSITSPCSDGTELDFFDTLPEDKVVYFHRYKESSSSQIKVSLSSKATPLVNFRCI